MSQTIDQAFISQFESEVHLAYQRMGSKLRNTVRTKSNINGKDTTFQKAGKGIAGQKSRHGKVPTMSIAHTKVLATLADYYAADYVDDLDELKTNIDERNVVVETAAGALGRKSDELLIAVTDATSNVVVHGSAAMNQTKINTVFNYFGDNDVPDDGQRNWVIGPQQWTNLLGISAFSDADFVGSDDLPYKGGMVARRWMSFLWFTHSGLTKASTTRTTMAYHKRALGFASGRDITSRWDWIPEKASMFYQANQSQGAVEIDSTGVYRVECTES